MLTLQPLREFLLAWGYISKLFPYCTPLHAVFGAEALMVVVALGETMAL